MSYPATPLVANSTFSSIVLIFYPTEESIKTFEAIKKILPEDTILHYPDFGKEFEGCGNQSREKSGRILVQETYRDPAKVSHN